jgi:hypothetical protein
MHARPTTPARPATPVVQPDEDTIRNAGIELDDDLFAKVEGVGMLKPTAMKKGTARPAENGVGNGETVDGNGPEEPVSSYYFNLAQLLSHHPVVRNLLEYMNFYEWCIL